jgi:hypothetical protein
MILWVKNNVKVISVMLIVVAILGFFLSAAVIEVDMLGISEELSVRNAFSFISGTTSNQSDMATSQAKLLELIDGNDAFAEVRMKFIMSVGAYLLVALLLLINLVLVLLGKWRKVSLVISAGTIALFSYAGYSVMSLSKVFYSAMEESLGFLAALVNVSEMVKFSLGTGYWLTLISLAAIFTINIVVLVANNIYAAATQI